MKFEILLFFINLKKNISKKMSKIETEMKDIDLSNEVSADTNMNKNSEIEIGT